ncbi:MAG: tRNA (guanosine(46)-N7)-methyltransferase TrmB [Burkholderiales bacterium]|jgi:tRNA (guanine-N7-)-methyltransferase|nr:tRNA (guanosine(46)-N7)-methyltransferase TrmB [Burkholderiales bacterium]
MNSKINTPIKSYVLRQGKITSGQKAAIETLGPKYVIPYRQEIIDLTNIFARDAPKIVEIGFGMGVATATIAQRNLDKDYLGIEVHSPGVGSLLSKIDNHKIANLKLIHHDAVEVITNMLANNSIYGVHIFFPDPWHKKKHNKRRLIKLELLQLLCDKIVTGGYIHIATDWLDYANAILELGNSCSNLENTSAINSFVPRPEYRPLTKFEERGLNLGHQVWDLIFVKV